MFLNKKLKAKEFCGYVVAQVLGALSGSLLLWAILALTGANKAVVNLGANSFISTTAGGIWASLIVEVILTFVFVYTILGVTSDKTLTFVHILGINLTGTSVNPARSLAPAILMGGDALNQVWGFIIAPLVGATLAAYTYRYLNKQ